MTQANSGKIIDVLTYEGWGGYFFEDLEKIREDSVAVADRYHTPTGHDRYPFVRTPARVVGIGLKMANGLTYWGDAVAVSFGGKSGRAGPGTPEKLAQWVRGELSLFLKGRSLNSWIETEKAFLGAFPLAPPFVRYAVSQAIVGACCAATTQTPLQLMTSELGLPVVPQIIPIHGSSGGDWGAAIERMLARNIMFLPQGQFENLRDQIGTNGEKLLGWVHEFKARAARFSYTPTLTLDFHGALDSVFDGDTTRIAAFLTELSKAAHPHKLHIESPIVGKSLGEHATRLAEIRSKLSATAPSIKIVADEWANEVGDIKFLIDHQAVDGIHIKMPDTGSLSECAEAVALCRQAGLFTLLGGSCTETDVGARLSAHLALATRPDAVLVKPGMGFDESYALLYNEMARAIT
jgi:methylaspartate ammonia-lyase